jgi:hypothetical protein
MWRVFIVLIFGVLGACQSLQPENVSQNLQGEIAVFATESAQIQQSVQIERTEGAQTLAQANARAQQQMAYNDQLLATVRAGEIATPQERALVQMDGAMPAEFMMDDGEMRFDAIRMASYVRPSDNCLELVQEFFNVNTTDSVYITSLVSNLLANTNVTVNWLLNGELMHQTNWTAPMDEARVCVAFALTRSDTTFQVGNWSANFFVNGNEIARIPFSFLDG